MVFLRTIRRYQKGNKRAMQWSREKRQKRQTIVYKIQYRKRKIEQYETYYNSGVNSGFPDG
jgi:hypothetical protein